MRKRTKIVLVVVAGIGIVVVTALLFWKMSEHQDPNNRLEGRNSSNSYYTTIFENQENSLEQEMQKNDDRFEEEEDVTQLETGNITLVFRKGKEFNFDKDSGELIEIDYIGGYEFVKTSGGYFYSGQRRLSLKHMELEREYTWEETFRADLALTTRKAYKEFVKNNYNVLPAWGISENADVENMTVDGQKIDQVIPIEMDEKPYYLWIIYDLETEKDAVDVILKVAGE